MNMTRAAASPNRRIGLMAVGLSLILAAWTVQVRALSMEEAKRGATDTWIIAQLTTTYALNDQLSPFDVGVDVSDGVVTLTGTVDSELEKELAAEIARGTDGVGKVENRLEVVPSEGEKGESEFRRFVDDAEISSKIRARVVWSKSMSLLDVDVSTQDNVVTLSGTVGSEADRERLGRIAANTERVRSVENRLEIAGEQSLAARAKSQTAEAVKAAGQAVSDGWITTKVTASLALDQSVDAGDIAVNTQDGVVSLSGTVADSAEAQTALDIASSIRGVKRVDAELSVAE